jgi:hypothetical protein
MDPQTAFEGASKSGAWVLVAGENFFGGGTFAVTAP